VTLPVPTAMAIAIYFTLWWTLLFAILPFGVRSQHETGEVVPGSEPGAPQAPALLKKAVWTTVVTTVVFIALMAVLARFPDA
jgi:predicted secreted protein